MGEPGRANVLQWALILPPLPLPPIKKKDDAIHSA